MATGIAGIWNQLAPTSPMNTTPSIRSEATSDPNGTASGSSAAISANDFLTLLVTEMKNQDPTANTDPNEYINQLVQVNSLEQLISINQTLLTDSGVGATGDAAHQSGVGPLRTSVTSSNLPASTGSTSPIAAPPSVTGNLSIPNIDPAALRVAGALAGHTPDAMTYASAPQPIHNGR